MSLKRRESFAWILIVLAAVCWSAGQMLLAAYWGGEIHETTAPMVTSSSPVSGSTVHPSYSAQEQHLLVDAQPESSTNKTAGFLLSFAGAVMALAAVFVLRRHTPLPGPDGVLLLSIMVVWGLYHWDWGDVPGEFWYRLFFAVVCITGLRELWGWLLDKCSLDWCLAERLLMRSPSPRLRLLGYVLWILAAALPCGFYRDILPFTLPLLGLAMGCLWRYGSDLSHLQKQLAGWQEGQPIQVGTGAFSHAEAQLLDIQTRHEEAVRTAVTGERFRVDLIANVSHDLRTPLTSILGCGELLESEDLSPAGAEQLRRLNQKAGYMRELVDSLFELTKVSSGVAAAKKEALDLIRLLEQTIGLYDDQLTAAGLVVRRSYCSDEAPIATDGGRMHQVFANLLGNAIKYALPGTRIYLEVRETEAEYRVRMLNTASYEMDFDPEEILQRFARGDKARSTRGSGLGLAIAQTYTESVGGRFSVGVDGDQFSATVCLPKTERNL